MSIAAHTKEAITRMILAGYETERIAKEAQVSVQTVNNLKNPEKNPEFCNRLDVLNREVLQNVAYYRYNMSQEMGNWLNTIREGSDPAIATNYRDRFEVAKYGISQVIPELPKAPQTLDVNVHSDTGAIAGAMLEVMEGHMEELTVSLKASNWKSRVKSGPEALPGPARSLSEPPEGSNGSDTEDA